MSVGRVRVAALAVGGVAVLVIVACAAPSSSGGPTVGPSETYRKWTLDVSLTDAMRIEPAEVELLAGQSMSFVVTNDGLIDHEFFLGDEEAQGQHEQEVAADGAVMHDHSNGIGLAPGETKELTYTFDAGEWIAGCHLPGHYAAGMKATITANTEPGVLHAP